MKRPDVLDAKEEASPEPRSRSRSPQSPQRPPEERPRRPPTTQGMSAQGLVGAGDQSKMGSAIDVVWRSWHNLDGDPQYTDVSTPAGDGHHGGAGEDGLVLGADTALLAAATRKVRISPRSSPRPSPRLLPPYAQGGKSGFHPRRPSSTLWDLKDARSSLSGGRPRSPLAADLPLELTGIKVYKRRWLMLAIFVFLGITNTFQWVQYSIIAATIQRYYTVSSLLVDLTCMSYLITYLLFFIPASWFLDKHGLRWALIVAAGLTSLGSWIKVGSVGRDRFWVTMVGQVVVAIGQVFMLFLPPRLASVWFGPDQVSLACSLGFIGILIGNAAGMLIPPQLVPNSKDLSQVGADLRSLFLGMAACTTASLVIQLARKPASMLPPSRCYAMFQEEPPLPPSPAQQLQRDREDDGQMDEFWTSLRRLLADKPFLLLLASWSLNVGVYCAINALLSQLVLPYHPGCEKEIGVVGLVMIASGIVGALMCGVFLDRTHKFKSSTMFLFVQSLVGWGVFTFLLPSGDMRWVRLTAGIYGYAMTAVQPVGLEFGAEVTFPEPEGTSAALMFSAAQLSGLILTFAGGYIMERTGSTWTMVFLGVPLLLACVILHFMRPEMKRQAAQHAPRRLSRLMSI